MKQDGTSPHRQLKGGGGSRSALKWATLAVTLGGALSASAVLQFIAGGLKLTPDSWSYLAAALSVWEGNGLLDHEGSWMATFPPGTSLLIAAFYAVVHDLHQAAVAVNAFSMMVFSASAVWFMRRGGYDFLAAVAVSITLALAGSLHWVIGYAWSEPVFLALMMTFLAFGAGAISRPQNVAPIDFVGMCITGAGMVAVRHVGLVVVLVTVALIVWLRWRLTRSTRGLWQLMTVVCATALMALVIAVINTSAAGVGFGGRGAPNAGWVENGVTAVYTISGWLLPLAEIAAIPEVRVGLVALAAAIALVVASRRRHESLTDPIRLLLMLAVVYAAVMIVLSSLTNTDPLADRLMIPVLPLLIVGAGPVVFDIARPDGPNGRWVAAPVIAWVGWLAMSVARVLTSLA